MCVQGHVCESRAVSDSKAKRREGHTVAEKAQGAVVRRKSSIRQDKREMRGIGRLRHEKVRSTCHKTGRLEWRREKEVCAAPLELA